MNVTERLPGWTRSVRFRLSLLYSSLLFGAGGVVLAAIYFTLREVLSRSDVYQTLLVREPIQLPDGTLLEVTRLGLTEVRTLEQIVNERTLDRLADVSFIALAALFLLSLIIGWFVAGRALRPIERITAVARNIQATDLSRRIRLQGPDDELHRLADTFDGMLDRIDTAFAAERTFIADASHELRNPLASIRTSVDVALSDPSVDSEEWRRVAGVVQGNAKRMSHLIDDLLTTARHTHRALAMDSIDARAVLLSAAAMFEQRAATRDVTVRVVDGGRNRIHGDRAALERAVANLVDNAIRLAPAGSTVRLADGHGAEWAWMAVEDQGPGIEPQVASHVFERFWRPAGRDASGEDHTGLGLAIVREIAASHGGTAVVHSEKGVGSTFVVWLPLVAGVAGSAPPAECPLPRL